MDDFIAEIETGRKIILTKDKYLGGTKFERTGYIAVFSVENVTVSESKLTFEIVDRLVDLA